MDLEGSTHADATNTKSSMGEINSQSISVLEREIARGRGDTIKLKRARNSLLNISVFVPPEILGYIFNLVVIHSLERMGSALHPLELDVQFVGLKKGWYNFLLVCHHWLEVAYATPGLWTFWGNSLYAWEERYMRAGSAPVDLALHADIEFPEILSVPLRNNLLHRTAQDTIREIHLDRKNLHPLTDILFTPGGEGTRERSIESIILGSGALPDLSNFFARSRLPKLRRLHLEGVLETPVWKHLTSQTTRLTCLSLRLIKTSPRPSTSQLFSILLSNPNLRQLSLGDSAFPDDIDESKIRVPLRQLEEMCLFGAFYPIFSMLQRLELTKALNYSNLFFPDDPFPEGFSRTLGPYMQNHLRRDTRFQGDLSVTYWSTCIHIYPVSEGIPVRDGIPGFHIEFEPFPNLPIFDLMAFAPLDHVVHFETQHSLVTEKELFLAMPNIEVLTIRYASLSNGFLQPYPNGPYANAKLLPSLRTLSLKDVGPVSDWRPLVDYLVHQTSNGQMISLELEDLSVIPPEVIEEVEGFVNVKLANEVAEMDWVPGGEEVEDV